MDPASALQVAAGAAQFVDLTANIFLELFQYFKSVKNAPKLSQELRDDALLLSDVLKQLESTLEATNPRPITASTNTLNETVEEFLKTMKDMEGHVVAEGEWKKWLGGPFCEKENKKYIERLKRYKNIYDSDLRTIQMY